MLEQENIQRAKGRCVERWTAHPLHRLGMMPRGKQHAEPAGHRWEKRPTGSAYAICARVRVFRLCDQGSDYRACRCMLDPPEAAHCNCTRDTVVQ